VNWAKLDSIDWDEFETTADWAKILNDLLGLVDTASDEGKRTKLATALDEFADHSVSDDLTTITKLDASARKAARALRITNMQERNAALAAASSDYQAAVKEFSAATAGLKKEASLLRLEKFTDSINALTGTITSLKTLAQVIEDEQNDKLKGAVDEAVKSAKKLRDILEKPA
jgi:hypothetical protein